MLSSFHYLRNYDLPLKLNPLHGWGGDANTMIQPTISEGSSRFKRNLVWLSCHKPLSVYSMHICALPINAQILADIMISFKEILP